MTDPKVLRKWYPDPTCQLGSDAIASTILTPLECQFMQLMGFLSGEILKYLTKGGIFVKKKRRRKIEAFPEGSASDSEQIFKKSC
jgi:hypothetical protein